jgi:hypothetical protein
MFWIVVGIVEDHHTLDYLPQDKWGNGTASNPCEELIKSILSAPHD